MDIFIEVLLLSDGKKAYKAVNPYNPEKFTILEGHEVERLRDMGFNLQLITMQVKRFTFGG